MVGSMGSFGKLGNDILYEVGRPISQHSSILCEGWKGNDELIGLSVKRTIEKRQITLIGFKGSVRGP